MSRSHSIELVRSQYPHLDLDFADDNIGDQVHLPDRIDLLVGADFYWALAFYKVKRGGNNGPVAIASKLSWILSGSVKGNVPLGEDRVSCAMFIRSERAERYEDKRQSLNGRRSESPLEFGITWRP